MKRTISTLSGLAGAAVLSVAAGPPVPAKAGALVFEPPAEPVIITEPKPSMYRGRGTATRHLTPRARISPMKNDGFLMLPDIPFSKPRSRTRR
jgi:hypothetical protein